MDVIGGGVYGEGVAATALENIPDLEDDPLNNEVQFGTLKGEIVGLLYYKGTVCVNVSQ